MDKYKFAYVANVKERRYFSTVIEKDNPYWLNDYILLPFSRKTKNVLNHLGLTYAGWV